MMNENFCNYCKKIFSVIFKNHKYCSKNCSERGKNLKHKIWCEKNKDSIEEKRKIYFKKNYERFKEYSKKNREKNKVKRRQQWHIYCKKRMKEDISFRMMFNLRNRLRFALKNNKKKDKTINLLGCSVNKFKVYIQSKFQEGMTWKNYGREGWHMDHIKPCSKFDLSKKEEQKKCFHYTNLQPLWAKDNLSKSNKWCVYD